jgi:hypothetical protein
MPQNPTQMEAIDQCCYSLHGLIALVVCAARRCKSVVVVRVWPVLSAIVGAK